MESQFIYERLTWCQVRKTFKDLNPEIAKLIDRISPSDGHGFVKISYPYGAKILNNGIIQVPNNKQEYVKIDDPRIPANLKKWLSYSPIPIGVPSRPMEVFIEPGNRIAPLNVLQRGCVFGLWETFDNPAANYVERLWNMSAGSRSISFLASISDAVGYRRIENDFNLTFSPPTSAYDEWNIFKEITRHPDAKCDWVCDVFFFDNTWFEKPGDSREWQEFKLFLYETAWNQLTHWRRKMYFDIAWESISLALVKRNLKPTQSQTSLIRHSIDAGHGIWPGMRIASDDTFAPISILQRIFSDTYRLKNYAPLMIQAQMCSPANNLPIYLSMGVPTHLDYAQKDRNAPSILSDMRKIILIHETMQQRLIVEDRPIFKKVKSLDYKYFHADVNSKDTIIKHTTAIHEYDPIMANQLKKYPDLIYPEKSNFLRGCILISSNQ